MFTIIYFLGMLFMIVATLAFPSLPYLNLTKESAIISPFLHIGMFVKAHQLLFSLTHLLALVVASFTDDDLEYAGATIRTAGYLYTLLGLTAALLYLNAEENKAAYYLASAAGTSLIPSIIGYFLGNAIEPSRREYMYELQKIEQTLRGSCASEERALQKIEQTLRDSCASEERALQEIKQMLQHSFASEKLALREIKQILQHSCASEERALQEINQTLQYSSSSKELANAHNAYIDMLVEIMEQAAAAIQNSTQKINIATDRHNRTQLDILTNLEKASRQLAELSEQLSLSHSKSLEAFDHPNLEQLADMPIIDLSGNRRSI